MVMHRHVCAQWLLCGLLYAQYVLCGYMSAQYALCGQFRWAQFVLVDNQRLAQSYIPPLFNLCHGQF